MAFPILQTKLYIPPPRPDIIPRPALLQRLEDGLRLDRKLTLISAPAGFGKSSLVSAWVKERMKAEGGRIKEKQTAWEELHPSSLSLHPYFSWLSLEKADNLPLRFWTYFVAALGTARAGLGEETAKTLQSAPPPPVEAGEEALETWHQVVLGALVNELAGLEGKLALVLDDYHLISNPQIHSGLGFLLDHLPRAFHLVIATRSDPSLPVSRLRARGQLNELRAADLRFSAVEANEFMRQIMGLELSQADVSTLEASTEGWIAGLQMAGLALQALRGQTDLSVFIQSFSGSHHYIIDYLAEEVLNRQSEEVQEFLLCTSILERFSASLCDDLIKDDPGESSQDLRGGRTYGDEEKPGIRGKDPSFSPVGPSAFILSLLERSNLFIIPLDGTRTWFRYHHLFGDLLRARLQQTWPERVAGLHRRAAAWFEENGLDAEAMQHALEGKDFDCAERIVLRGWQRMSHAGLVDTVLEWLSGLPEERVLASNELISARAWLCYLKGNLAPVEGLLQQAARALEQEVVEGKQVPGSPEYAVATGQMFALRSVVAIRLGKLDVAVENARRTLETSPADFPLLQGIAHYSLGHVLRVSGELEPSCQEFALAIPLLKTAGNFIALANVILYLSRNLLQLGRPRQAEQTCREAILSAGVDGWERLPAFCTVHLGLAETLLEMDRLDEAVEQLAAGNRLSKLAGSLEMIKNGAIVAARIRWARADLAGAQAALDEAEPVVRRGWPGPLMAAELAAWQARLALAAGNLIHAKAWAVEVEQRLRAASGPVLELEKTTLVRVWIHDRRAEEARAFLTELIAAAQAAGRSGSLIELLILLSRACQVDDQGDAARDSLDRAIGLAETQGLARSAEFSIAELKESIKMVQPGPYAHSGHQKLYNQQSTTYNLIEPLSEREIEILRLIAAGCSNRQIAEQLVLALGTVKTHVHNIAGKLGAENRVQAIARARELGILGD